MKNKKIKFWTKEEDEIIIEKMTGIIDSKSLASYLKKYNLLFSSRSEDSIYQRILYIKFMKKQNRKILYRKPGVPVGTKRATYKRRYLQVRGRSVDLEEIEKLREQSLELQEKVSKEVVLPKGMSIEFTGKKISITDTYIKIYI